MKWYGIIKNDVSAAPGVCVSFFVQGCPIHCKGCHNPDSQSFRGGRDFTSETMEMIIESLTANSVHRDLCIMGGEPLCKQNTELTALIVKEVNKQLPDVKIYVWSGYYLEELKQNALEDENLDYVLNNINCIIDGPFELDKRDITLHMRGSSNQRVIYLK